MCRLLRVYVYFVDSGQLSPVSCFQHCQINVFQVSKEPESAATITKPQTEDVKTVSLASDKVSMQNTQMAYDTHE